LARTGGGYRAVDDKLSSCEVRCVHTDIVRVRNKVATNSKSCSFCLGFLWTVIANKSAIGHGSVGRDTRNWDEEDGVCPGDACTNALGEPPEFISK
jgi:hypothetical protein